MMLRRRFLNILTLLILIGFCANCRDPFDPEIRSSDISILVVEGYIEVDDIPSTIRLTKLTPLIMEGDPPVEVGATVILQSSTGDTAIFREEQPGHYHNNDQLDPNLTYHLQIHLNNGDSYLSDVLQPLETPPIDQVRFIRKDDGVEIFVSTKGTPDTPYFLWHYEQDWIFRPRFPTIYIFNPETGNVEVRTEEQRINYCWNKDHSPRVLIENAGRFDNYTISQQELVHIPLRSEKLMQRYSILVNQKSISREAFDFWEIVRRNTEDIGGIFSPLPSLVGGNINPTSEDMPKAIGFVSMGRSQSKRLYINVQEVAPWVGDIEDYQGCMIEPDTISPSSYSAWFSSGSMIPIVPVYAEVAFLGYLGAPARCVDCTLRGEREKPDFWED